MSLLFPKYIDPELPLSEKDRRAVHSQAWSRWWNQPSNWLLVVVVIIGLSVPLNLAPRLMSMVGWASWWGLLVGAAGVLIYVALIWFIVPLAFPRIRYARRVWSILRERGHDVCLHCGYWLRALPEDADRCPECGTQRQAMNAP